MDNLNKRCEKCSSTTNVVEINLKRGTHLLCKKCRYEYNVETEEDIIDELRHRIKTPIEIFKELDKVVIGQDYIKKVVSVEVYNHFMRLINRDKVNIEIKKNNIMMTGPSGSGKTLIAETLSKILGVPFIIENATSLTESGYVGKDVETILSRLLQASNYSENRAKFGIVFIDEIDKIAKKGENMSITRDVSGEGVQQALLKIIEGTEVGVPLNGSRIHPNQELLYLDTKDILFLCGGAFDGVENIVKDRLKINKKRAIGFGSVNTDLNKETDSYIREHIDVEDLMKFGMIPEFIGRFPTLCNLKPLDKEQLISILKNENGLIKEYEAKFAIQNKKLTFDEATLDVIAELSIHKKVGARGLRGLLSNFMTELMFIAPSEIKEDYIVTEEDICSFYKYNVKSKKEEKAVLSA